MITTKKMEWFNIVCWCCALFATAFWIESGHCKINGSAKLRGVRFLVTVNDTWWAEPPGCIATIASPMVALNKSVHLIVGDCDQGPIEYMVQSPGKNYNKYTVTLTFHSSVIEDASPPVCDLSWNGTYLVPKDPMIDSPDLLPSCFTMDSREGYHMTYYWFHLLDWEFE